METDFVLLASVFVLGIAFIGTLIVTPWIIRAMIKRGITGKDMNKLEKPAIAELGGIGVWTGFNAGIVLAIFISSYLKWIELNLTLLFAGYAVILVVSFIGVVDDLIGWKKGLRQYQHALLPVFASLPLMAIKIANPPIRLPLLGFAPAEYFIPGIGIVSFGLMYSLFFVPIGVTGSSNAANMLAGLNGLEAGLGSLILFTLAAITLLLGRSEAFFICIALIGALIAFLKFNWHPAKIFGGDSLTLMIGAAIGVVSIIGDIEKIGVMLMALYFIELLFKAKHKFQSECFGIPQKDGTLSADPRGGSLTQWVMRRGKFTEKQIVQIILGMQAIVCAIVFTLFWFRLILV